MNQSGKQKSDSGTEPTVRVDALVRRINPNPFQRGKYYKVLEITDVQAKICWINESAPLFQRMEIEFISNLIPVETSA